MGVRGEGKCNFLLAVERAWVVFSHFSHRSHTKRLWLCGSTFCTIFHTHFEMTSPACFMAASIKSARSTACLCCDKAESTCSQNQPRLGVIFTATNLCPFITAALLYLVPTWQVFIRSGVWLQLCTLL